jgi:hypothetical protein
VKTPSTYASITYAHRSFLVRYPHRQRLKLLAAQVRQRSVRSWLDYGAGDGAVFAYCNRNQSFRDSSVVLYEPWESIRKEITLPQSSKHVVVARFEDIPNTTFDLITALEVLEHLPLSERIRFYRLVAERLGAGGRCLVEVPVEAGPILLVKELGRRILKGRSSSYTARELLAACLGHVSDTQGRYRLEDDGRAISSHYGFNTFAFFAELQCIGHIKSITPSPFTRLPAILNQCVLIEFTPMVESQQIEQRVRQFAASALRD